MAKTITGVLIDPENGIAEVRTIEDSLDSFYATLHCTCIDIPSRLIGVGADKRRYAIVCDDEGLLKENNFVTATRYDREPMLVGALFVCKDGQNGELASLTDEEAEHVLSYTSGVWRFSETGIDVWHKIYAMDYDY